MKNVSMLVILGAAGYFAYDYFIGSQTASDSAGEYSLFLSEQCGQR